MPRTGFVWFIGLTAALFLFPLLAVIGTAVLWGLLPFVLIVIVGVWYALERTYRSGQVLESMRLSQDRLYLRRHDPGCEDRTWDANPYWVRPILRGGPVQDYLTLTDGGREVELGVFLTPEERRALRDELLTRLAALR